MFSFEINLKTLIQDAVPPPEDTPENIERLKAKLAALQGPEMKVELSEMLVLGGVVVSIAIMSLLIDYAYKAVLITHAMVEQPKVTIIATVTDYDDKHSQPIDREGLAITQAPVTNNIRHTFKHIKQVAGRSAYWSGLGIAAVYTFFHTVLCFSFGLHRSGLSSLPFQLVAAIVLSKLHMLWTHEILVSKSMATPWRKRLFQGRFFIKPLIIPTSLTVLAYKLMAGTSDFAVSKFWEAIDTEEEYSIPQFLVVVLLGMLTLHIALNLLIPSLVTLTRVEAGLLPEDAETIVHFDRAAYVAPTAVCLETDEAEDTPAGRRCQRRAAFRQRARFFLSLFKSVTRKTKFNVVKIHVKVALLQIVLYTLGFMSLAATVWALGGDRLVTVVGAVVARFQLEALGQ